MNNLIIPCAGRSSRYPDMRPKWMLTHPDGALMVEKAISGMNLEIFDRIIFTTILPHASLFESDLVLKQVFSQKSNIEICILDDFTPSVVDTVMQTIRKMSISGSLVIRDADNYVKCIIPENIPNAVVGLNISQNRSISHIESKSFIILNEQDIITNIVEKKIVSQYISLGVYCFESCKEFTDAANELTSTSAKKELYVSHVIAYLISQKNLLFSMLPAISYEDWGTIYEWLSIQKQKRAYFIDIDGVIMKNSGKYGSVNWFNNDQCIQENVDLIKKLQKDGAQIVLVTSRPESTREHLMRILDKLGINPYAIIMGLYHSPRTLINDFAPSNPYPSATAISIPRNASLKEYLIDSVFTDY